MALLPQLKRLSAEDFKDAPPWFMRLLYPLNLFMISVYSALNNQLTFESNMLSQIRSATLNGSSPTAQFTWPYASAPIGVTVISALDISPFPLLIKQAVTCAWSYSAGVVNIENVTGLTNGRNYSVTFLVIGG